MATIEDLPDDVATRVLRQLDGPSLAAASCAAAHLRSLSNHPSLWRSLCIATWPSLRQRRLLPLLSKPFFSDAFSFPDDAAAAAARSTPAIISAVDIFHRGKSVSSLTVETETNNSWFLSSPLRIESPPVTLPAVTAEELTLSWIIIDPATRRAVNVSSLRAVEIRRRRHVGSTQLIFAVVMAGGAAAATVGLVLEGGAAHVSLTVQDNNGVCLNGERSMKIIGGVIGGGRRGRDGGAAANAAAYGEFVARMVSGKEKRAAMERRDDLLCVLFGVFFLFLGVFFFLVR